MPLKKATELKKRIWFTLGALIIYRFGTYIPLPGIDTIVLQDLFSQQQGGIIQGALGKFDQARAALPDGARFGTLAAQDGVHIEIQLPGIPDRHAMPSPGRHAHASS